jgi:2-phosphosulfolactate phosphatase
MSVDLAAYFLPALIGPGELDGQTAVVIDLLRASTTICHALAEGAQEVIPCLEVDEAKQIAAQFSSGQAVLGGERDGVKIPGFDLGNSPEEYTPETVGGRSVVFTTTNGTRAMNACRGAARVFIGSFVCLSALCERFKNVGPINLICAGTKGKITREDVVCAGAIADRLLSSGTVGDDAINDQARIAWEAWRQAMPSSSLQHERLALTLRHSQGGRNLIALGLQRDIDAAAQIDRFMIVPELDLQTWRITAAKSTDD